MTDGANDRDTLAESLAAALILRGWTAAWLRHLAQHILESEWLAARDERIQTEALADCSEDEANLLDRFMADHMYHHSISNNIAGMGCDVGCRTDALRRGVTRILKARDTQSSVSSQGGAQPAHPQTPHPKKLD